MDVREVWRKVLYLGRRSGFESELNDELQFHIECRAGELEQSGMSRKAAVAQAKREFGRMAIVSENSAASWRIAWIEDLISDLHYAARALRRNPALAAIATLCLTLGIGADTAIYSLATNLLLSAPSGRDPSSLIAIWEGGNSASSLADYKFLRNAHVFEGLAGINPEGEVNWRDGDRSRRLYAGMVADDYFSTLDSSLLLGRGIAPGETATVVLSHRLWKSGFGGDPAVLGREMIVDGRQYTIVGVLPQDHRNIVGFGFSPEIYVPAIHDTDLLQFYARLPRGMTHGAARARLQSVFAALDGIDPKEGWKRASEVRVTGASGMDVLAQEQLGPVVAFFAMLLVVVGLVLLIACTNVAGLLLARAASRSHEIAVRLSLGAGRMRIVRHLLAESLLLSLLGAAAGIGLELSLASAVSGWTLPLPIPIQIVITPDWRLAAYSICVVAVSALICGLLPAVQAVRRDVNTGLKLIERQTERAWGIRSGLMVGQIAVCAALLATGFLFLHNLQRVTSMDPGFDTRHTLAVDMRLVPDRYTDHAKQTGLVREALDRLKGLPGVTAAAITRRVPLNDNCMTGTSVRADAGTPVHVNYECNEVGPDYFCAIGIPLRQGREFTFADRKGGPAVAIVNETFARTLFGSVEPVGHTIETMGRTLRIVGVAKDSKYFTLGERQRLAVYEPYFAREEPGELHFIVQSSTAPAGYVQAITDALGRLDSTAAIEAKPMIRAMGIALLPSQAGAAILGTLGLLGLALAAIGLYGAVLYAVSRRTREIGVRMALGAGSGDILRTVCGHSFGLLACGLTIGLALAFFVTQPLAMFLAPGLSPSDPASFGGVVAALAAVAAAATVIPAIRALRVDPMTALRYE